MASPPPELEEQEGLNDHSMRVSATSHCSLAIVQFRIIRPNIENGERSSAGDTGSDYAGETPVFSNPDRTAQRLHWQTLASQDGRMAIGSVTTNCFPPTLRKTVARGVDPFPRRQPA